VRAIRVAVAVCVAFAGLTAAGATTVAGASPAATSAVRSSGHCPSTGILQCLRPGYFNLPVVEPGGKSRLEGNRGFRDIAIPVVLSPSSTKRVTVDYRTIYLFGPIRHEAIPFLDYRRTTGTVTFKPGETLKFVRVPIRGDFFPEHDEVFVLQFGRPHNARMGGYWGLGFGKIINDDDIFCPFQLCRS